MSKRTKKTNAIAQAGECAYCSRRGEVTRDHVIPQCLFERPIPGNIPIVLACHPCNNAKKSADDNLLRDLLVSDVDAHEHPLAQAKYQKLRSSVRKGHSTFARYALRARPVERRTQSGLYVGLAYEVRLPLERVNRMIARIVRGLCFFYTGELLLPTATYAVYRVENIQEAGRKVQALMAAGGIEAAIGDGKAFRCVYLRTPGRPEVSNWLLFFYEGVVFSVTTNYELLGVGDPPAPLPRVT